MPDTPERDTVYFYKFNNYYNRIIKRYDTIEEYGDPIGSQENCNFVHGDGINASFTFNKLISVKDTPDYVIVLDRDNKISRWFVINSFKNRGQQDSLQLRRDVIADFYDDIVHYSPCLIRKGWVPQTSPFIFNDEGVRYNKIKTEEIKIKDYSNCSYIVGFIANDSAAVAQIDGTVKATNYDYSFTDLASFPYSDYVEGAGGNHTEVATHMTSYPYLAIRYTVTSSANVEFNAELSLCQNGQYVLSGYTNTYTSGGHKINNALYCKQNGDSTGVVATAIDHVTGYNWYYDYVKDYADLLTSMSWYLATDYFLEKAKALFPSTNVEETYYSMLKLYDNKLLKIGGTVYKARLKSENLQLRKYTASNDVKAIVNTMLRPTETSLSASLGSGYKYKTDKDWFNNTDIDVYGKTADYYLELVEATTTVKTELKAAANRTHLTDQPFDMFVLINDDDVSYKVGTDSFTSNHEVNMNMAQAICQASGSASYDLQIVPFNPIQGAILADGTINWLNYDVVPIKDSSNNIVGHYVMCNSGDLQFELEKDELKFNPEDYKLDFNTKEYRLCSPNQETIFEFSPSMNFGINKWVITANYRPYSSYIKVQPQWNGLYGASYYDGQSDFRGLLYNSTLCVTQLSEQWATYVSNNKNYQQLFDNQINTLTKSNNVTINALEETLGWRSFTGGPIGSVARVIGGSRDIEMQKELNNIAISKMETDFKYQLDNIKSMPNTVKKLTNINGDTRIFPYIEVFTCTTEEETSFQLKMQYTGYTIMTTGYIIDYIKPNVIPGEEIGSFVQADLIRLDLTRSDETADNHIAIEIASELEKGVYLTKEE